jgi:hypothetical protein
MKSHYLQNVVIINEKILKEDYICIFIIDAAEMLMHYLIL